MSKSMKEFGKDKSSFANMPQDVHMNQYPKQSGLSQEQDDTITGIDETIAHSKGKAKKHASNQK